MINKFYQDNVLLEQKFVKDDTRTVANSSRSCRRRRGEKVEVVGSHA